MWGTSSRNQQYSNERTSEIARFEFSEWWLVQALWKWKSRMKEAYRSPWSNHGAAGRSWGRARGARLTATMVRCYRALQQRAFGSRNGDMSTLSWANTSSRTFCWRCRTNECRHKCTWKVPHFSNLKIDENRAKSKGMLSQIPLKSISVSIAATHTTHERLHVSQATPSVWYFGILRHLHIIDI